MKHESKPHQPELAPELLWLGPFSVRGRLIQTLLGFIGWRSANARAHVREILERPDVFSVEGYAERMRETTGDFFLGVDDPVRHARERDWAKAALDQALTRTGVERELDAWAREARDANTIEERLDLHSGLCVPVLIELTKRLFGIRLAPPDFEAIRLTNKHIFDPFSRIRRDAMARGRALKGLFREQIEARAAEPPSEPETALDFLLADEQHLPAADFEDVSRTLAGLVSGATAVTTFVFHRIAERLMGLPDDLPSRLQRYAQNDRAQFDAYVREAWRFVPGPPLVYRRATRAFTLAERSRCPMHIEQGQKVIVNLAAAQLDAGAVENQARHFDPARPQGEAMLFGYGQHYCIGDHLGWVAVSSLVHALFERPGGTPRAAGKPDKQPQGYVKHVVEFR